MSDTSSGTPVTDQQWVAGVQRASRTTRLRDKISAYEARVKAASVLAGSESVGYLGWSGYQNLGDEAIFDALKAASSSRLVVVPPDSGPLSRRYVDMLYRRLSTTLLGGGTLVGVPAFRRRLERIYELSEDPAVYALGVGVEHPTFDDSGGGEIGAELSRWSPLLRRFRSLSVRGPLSQETLNSYDVNAPITADPALLLRAPAPDPSHQQGLLGLNIGIARKIWGSDPSLFLERVVAFASEMISRGWRVRFLPVWPRDMEYIRAAAGSLGSGAQIFEDYLNLEAFLAALRQCHVVVGQKLHSVVLATSQYVPAIALEYHPKCLDFQLSVGRDRFNVRTDRVDVSDLVDLSFELAEARADHQALLHTAVEERVAPLESELAGLDRAFAHR